MGVCVCMYAGGYEWMWANEWMNMYDGSVCMCVLCVGGLIESTRGPNRMYECYEWVVLTSLPFASPERG